MTIPQAFDLALQHHRAGRLADAEALYRQILAVESNNADALHLLGLVAHQAGRHDLAVVWIRASISLNPGHFAAYSNLGVALDAQGKLDEAIAAYRRALELKPDSPEAHVSLGATLSDQGQFDEAITEFRRALELKPDYPEAHSNLGCALWKRGQLDEAVAACRHALALKPDFPEAHHNLGNALKDQGDLNAGIAAFRQALRIKPHDASTHSNMIYALHYHPGYSERTIAEECQRWNRRFSGPLNQFVLPHTNERAMERRLRVGYVSPDFRNHPVGRYLLPLFERHDRDGIEIFCYSGVARSDWMTERLRALAAGWRNTVGVSDACLAEMIREEAIDILVDLSLHSGHNRLPVFARRPAPVQVTWLGYPGSSGLPSIDYRLTDAQMDPPGEKPAWSAEEPVRLPDCWCCYHPVDESPEINALPALSSQGVTFGSLNNFAKVHEGALGLWARVLKGVAGSRLLMLCPEGRARERVRAFFGARDIGAERVEFVGKRQRWEYLSLYHRIDLGLDPFPCNGMTTTCDALWMGVPVLTIPGEMPVSRAGLSLLSAVGLGELVTYSEDDYVRFAVELAGNLPRLTDLRTTLRARMLASPLMDAPRFARNVEAAYRSMWQRWCAGRSPGGKDI